MPSSATTKGEVWYFTVQPNDGEELGDLETSPTITIQNTDPVIDSFAPVSQSLESRESLPLQFEHTSTDPDENDGIDTLTFSWKLDTIEQATTQNWLYSIPVDECSSKTVELTVSDGTVIDTTTWDVDIQLKGDVDGNNKVDIFDLARVGLSYGSTQAGGGNWNPNADLAPQPLLDGTPEGDNSITIQDLAAVGMNFGRSCS